MEPQKRRRFLDPPLCCLQIFHTEPGPPRTRAEREGEEEEETSVFTRSKPPGRSVERQVALLLDLGL
jgi:hypothetical protein